MTSDKFQAATYKSHVYTDRGGAERALERALVLEGHEALVLLEASLAIETELGASMPVT